MIVTVLVAPAGIDGGENVFVAPITWTFSCAESGERFVSPCCVSRALAGIVLTNDPCVSEVTFTRIVHVEFGAIVASLRRTEVPPLGALREAEVEGEVAIQLPRTIS